MRRRLRGGCAPHLRALPPHAILRGVLPEGAVAGAPRRLPRAPWLRLRGLVRDPPPVGGEPHLGGADGGRNAPGAPRSASTRKATSGRPGPRWARSARTPQQQRWAAAFKTWGTSTRSAERFDPERNLWEALPTMGSERRWASAAATGGRHYVLGGLQCQDCYHELRGALRPGAQPLGGPARDGLGARGGCSRRASIASTDDQNDTLSFNNEH